MVCDMGGRRYVYSHTCPSSFLLPLDEVLSIVRYWTRTMCLLVMTSSGAFMMR